MRQFNRLGNFCLFGISQAFLIVAVSSAWANPKDHHQLCQAIGKSKMEPCMKISNPSMKEMCQAILHVEENRCLKILDADLKNVCIGVAGKSKREESCNQVINEDWKLFCHGRAKSQQSLCLRIVDVQLRGACYSLAASGDHCIPEGTDPKKVPFEPSGHISR